MMKRFIVTFIFLLIGITMATSQNKGKYASVNGLNMYYEIHGQGKPLVLIHGGGSTIGTTFGRVLQNFAKTHQVIAVELQAHGHTADIDRPLSFEQDADDVAELLRVLKITKADFLGFSNGGSTTLQIVIRHPEIVNKIIIASGMYKRTGTQPWFWDFINNARFEDMPQALKDAYLEINLDQKALRVMHDRDLTRIQSFTDMDEKAIRSIQAPTLILIGDKDVVTPEHAVEMYHQIPNARLLILPGGHGDYIGEITTIQPNEDEKEYPAVSLIKAFLADF